MRDDVPIYGSGGFTSYSLGHLQQQLAGWVGDGIPRVKMKVGRHAQKDPARVDAARRAIGSTAELFVDANGSPMRKRERLLRRLAHSTYRPEEGASSGGLGAGWVKMYTRRLQNPAARQLVAGRP